MLAISCSPVRVGSLELLCCFSADHPEWAAFAGTLQQNWRDGKQDVCGQVPNSGTRLAFR